MAIQKAKTGRRRDDDERKFARELVALYRKAQQAPGGWLCVNPDDPQDEQTWIDGNDPDRLLMHLEAFAKHGTFVFIDTIGLRDFLFNQEATRLLAVEREKRKIKDKSAVHTKGALGPIEAVAKQLGLSKSKLEGILREAKAPAASILKIVAPIEGDSKS